MKTLDTQTEKRLTRIFVLLAALLFLRNACVGQSFRDSLTCMEITGKIGNLKGSPTPYKVELIKDTLVIDVAYVSGKSKFKFFLEKDTYYGIRISQEGYISRVISVCTDIPKNKRHDKYYRFHFDTDLLEASQYDHLNKDALDFPIALVVFDKKMRCFYYSEDYTANIKKKIYNTETASKH